MDSASKRKAASGAASETESRPAKRQKLPGDTDGGSETSEKTTTMGLKFLESLRAAKDKTGRPIATHFLTLPSKNELPEYYEVIKLPIAIDTIEARLNSGGYTSLAQVESDCKRLVNNAKAYNDKKSIIYEDAERLRKTASNWMVKHNPAYRDSKYVAVATPVPGEEAGTPIAKPTPRPTPRPTPKSVPRAARAVTPKTESPAAEMTITTTERPRRAAALPQLATPLPPAPPSRARKPASALEQTDDSPDFAGKTFQQAQDQIVRELIDYQDPGSDLQIFQPFLNLPTRALKDYYQVIKNPMSLSAVQKKVRGVIGRNPPTGFTELKSWSAFEQDMSLIWTNAQIYNEDGSDIYNLANELKDVFEKRLAEAKSKVDEPPQPKLKLNMSAAPPKQPSLKLKLRQSPGPGSDPNTPAARSSATPSFIVDNEALQRQQRHVQDSMNGSRNSRPSSSGRTHTPSAPSNPFAGPRSAAVTVAPLAATRARVVPSPPVANGIKHDVQSPALNSIRPASIVPDSHSQRQSFPQQAALPVMPPPLATARTLSGSPHPHGPVGQQAVSFPQYHPPNYYVPPTTPQFIDFRQTPLRSISEALLPKIVLKAHPALNLPRPFSVDILAHKEKSSHSVTINLPSTHAYLQIIPHIPVALTGRAYRLFVLVNGNKTLEVNRAPVTAGINGSSQYDSGKKKGEPVFEAKLMQGVNRIEVHIIAEKDRRGKPESKDPKEQAVLEKCQVFANLMKPS